MADDIVMVAKPKKTSKAPKKPVERKTYNEIDKKIIQRILDRGLTDAKAICEDVKISQGMARKIIKYIQETEWKLKTDNSVLPQGYFLPKTYVQIIDCLMFDKGFCRTL